jgi:hypothetical protein
VGVYPRLGRYAGRSSKSVRDLRFDGPQFADELVGRRPVEERVDAVPRGGGGEVTDPLGKVHPPTVGREAGIMRPHACERESSGAGGAK